MYNVKLNRPLICILSCVGTITETPIQNWLAVLARENYRLVTVMAEHSILHEPSFGQIELTNIKLPNPSLFWPDGGFNNTVKATFQRFRNSISMARNLANIKPDICICSEPDAWLVAVILKKKLKFKIIVYLREVFDDRLLIFPRSLQKTTQKMLHWILAKLSRYTDEIIHVSLERQALYLYLNKPGVVISNYSSLLNFPDQQNIKSSNPIPNENIVVIHAGALRPTYRSDLLIDAMSIVHGKLPSLKFIVLGGIVGKLRNINIVNELIENGGLEMIPQVEHSEVIKILYQCDIGIMFVFPDSLTTRFAAPLKLYEYLAAGLPVVGSDVPTVRKVLTDWNCGLIVDPGLPEDVAKAIVELAQNEMLRKELGGNARKATKLMYNWESEVPKILQVVNSMIYTKTV